MRLTSELTVSLSARSKQVASTATRLPLGRYIALKEYEDLGEYASDVPAPEQLETAYDSHLSSHPEDVEKWIAYATSIAERNHSQGHSRRALSEVALATLSRAIEAHPANAQSVELQVAFMKAAGRVWKANKLISKWEELLNSPHGLSFTEIATLWLEYLDYRETTGSLSDALDTYAACLTRLPHSAGTTDPLDEYQTYVVLRCSMLLKRAGKSPVGVSSLPQATRSGPWQYFRP